MLIPSIDLQDGHVVQLVQGEKLAIEAPDPEPWIRKFARFPRVQLIDLDAAKGQGDNAAIVAVDLRPASLSRRRRDSQRRARAGGPRRTALTPSSSARRSSATAPWISTSRERSPTPIGADRVIAAVDSRGGHVAIHGWKTVLPITAVEAVQALEPYCGEFLYTHVDKEGLMQGTDMDAILAVRRATSRRLTAAGGITTREEIDRLHAEGIDAVVGMAIYTGQLSLDGLVAGR